MAVWIVSIAKEQPGNLKQAISNGFWDMTSSQEILAGDDIVFWQLNGASVSSGPKMLAVATSAADPILAGDPPGGWGEPDDRDYTRRFTFDVVSEDAMPGFRWGDMQKAIGGRPRQWSVLKVEVPAAIDLLLSQFRPS